MSGRSGKVQVSVELLPPKGDFAATPQPPPPKPRDLSPESRAFLDAAAGKAPAGGARAAAPVAEVLEVVAPPVRSRVTTPRRASPRGITQAYAPPLPPAAPPVRSRAMPRRRFLDERRVT